MAEENENSDLANLAELVAAGETVRSAAESLGIAERSAYRISATVEFKAEVNSIRTGLAESLSGRALSAAETALAQLESLATTAEKESDQIAACKAILDKMLVLADNVDLRRRLHDLERGAAEAAGQTGGDTEQADAV